MFQIDFQKPMSIYFVGIGGISMSGLAEILHTAGFATLDVRTPRRLPCPPANNMAIISFLIMLSPLSSYYRFVGIKIITHAVGNVNIYSQKYYDFSTFSIYFLQNFTVCTN